MFGFGEPTYDPVKDIPDLTGKVAIVTGANSGIGYQTAQQLVNHGAKVYLAGRNESKVLVAIEQMQKENQTLRGKNMANFLHLDLSEPKGVKAAADAFMAKESRLDILVNNAAAMNMGHFILDIGLTDTMMSNYIGPWIFTTSLLPLMKKTAADPLADVRIVNVASQVHSIVPVDAKLDSVDDLNQAFAEGAATAGLLVRLKRYGLEKLCEILFTTELQRRLDEESVPITCISLHPGMLATGAMKEWWIYYLLKVFGDTPLQAAKCSLFAATSPVVKEKRDEYKGKFLMPVDKITPPLCPQGRDEELAKRLWLLTETVVNNIFEKGVAQ
ncbi:hypothetical protein BZG36_05305 [Bifiguratus adelaidae]|uniref:NAD(P)-binding protein n=1 Tax=Bifiguratus adelaidae TaxID=1938954 RepID=A0A261XTS2_9FUNG|nr:hypothetical protein BZG36_05305 [Bifiguratus adelaidae]